MTEKPQLTLERVTRNGKTAIRLIVRNATPELRPLLDELGILPVCDIASVREIICSSPEELDAARNPLLPLFDGKGAWR